MSMVLQIKSKDLNLDRYIVKHKTRIKKDGKFATIYQLFVKEDGDEIYLTTETIQTPKNSIVPDDVCVIYGLDELRLKYVK